MNTPQLLSGTALEAANAVYTQIRFQLSNAETDRTFGILEAGEPVALGRIQRHPGDEFELGGFWVQEERRGTGLARKLVAHVLGALDPGDVVWCIAFEHLADFYCTFDMKPFEHSAAPESIRRKLAFCEEQRAKGLYHPVRLLRYERPSAGEPDEHRPERSRRARGS